MSLSHVYIVLEPVGSARLTFYDDRYYEFMCFDVPKVVRSPGCDHGHDEVSLNGRDIKIDIFDHVVRTPEVFRRVSDKTGVPEGVTGTPGRTNGLLWALVEKREGSQEVAHGPPCPNPNWTRRRGGGPPLLPSLHLLLPSSPSWNRKGRGQTYLE